MTSPASRRRFLQLAARHSLALTGAAALLPSHALALASAPTLILLHTNDVHSHLDPLPLDHPDFPGQGGAARRATVFHDVRRANPNTLVLDAGDLFMGTPYFEEYQGAAEIRAFSAAGYDAATIGNHEFDPGIERFAEVIRQHATFPFLSANYLVDGSALDGLVAPARVFQLPDFRVGVFGLGIKLDGLVMAGAYAGVRYTDPMQAALRWSAMLRHDERCDAVVCLSHLSPRGAAGEPGDEAIARASSDIDVIIGGHSHTLYEAPEPVPNALGRPVMLNQVGSMGVRVGRIDLRRAL